MGNELETSTGEANQVLVQDSISYNVVDGPAETSPLVLLQRDQWLAATKMDMIVSGIDRSDDLLHIAACGVAGFQHPDTKEFLGPKVIGLQVALQDATSAMVDALKVFEANTKLVTEALRRAFTDLYDLYEDDAIETLGKCEEIAHRMTTASEALGTRFTGVRKDAVDVLKDTMSTRDFNAAEKLKAEERQRIIDARHKRMDTLSKEIAAKLPQVEARYNEAKEAQVNAENRAFALGITSAIVQGIGSAISAGLAIKTAPVRAGSELAAALAESRLPPPAPRAAPAPAAAPGPAAAPSSAASNAAAIAAIEKRLGTAEATLRKAKADAAAAESALHAAAARFRAAIDNESDDADREAELHKEAEREFKRRSASLEEADAAHRKIEGELAEAKRAGGTAAGASPGEVLAAGVGAGLSSAGQSMGNQTDSYSQIAANYAKEKAQYLKMLMDLQKEERDALAEVAELTKQMQNEGITANLAQAAVDSLQKAVGALREIAEIVAQLRDFWAGIARGCRELGSSATRDRIATVMKRPEAKRIKEYSSTRFQFDILLIGAKWVSLGLVCREYSEAIAKTRFKMSKTFVQNPSIEEAHKLAQTLSDQLTKKIESQMAKLDAERKDIANAIEETKALEAGA